MPEDVLLTIAEVSVALVGFSGVATALRAGPAAEWQLREIRSLWVIIGLGVGTMLFSFLPFPLGLLDLSSASVWRWSSALLGGVLAIGVSVGAYSIRREIRSGGTVRYPRFARGFVVFSTCLSVTLLLNAAVLPAGGAPGYVAALVVLLVAAIVYFGVFITSLMTAGRP